MTQRQEIQNDNLREQPRNPASFLSKWKEIIRADEIRTVATTLYLLLMLVMFPLYVENRYRAMGDCKWKFYCAVTLPYLAVMLLAALPGAVRCIRGRKLPQVGLCDLIVGVYSVCVLISFGMGDERQALWQGASGWHMGVAAQLLFAASYLAVSRSKVSAGWLAGCNAVGSGICFLIGILQRLGFDLLDLYYGIPNVAISDFLSTIGNRTWMSGYACAVFPMGVYLYWRAEAYAVCRTGTGSGEAGGRGAGFWQRLLWGGIQRLGVYRPCSHLQRQRLCGIGGGVFRLGGTQHRGCGKNALVWAGAVPLVCLVAFDVRIQGDAQRIRAR